MLNSLSACGTTLLDTINHVMDFSKLTGCDSKRKGLSSRRLQNSNTIRLSSKPVKGSRHENLAFDFAIATEEVVEAVFSGASYLPVASKLMEAPTSPSDEPPNSVALRKFCFVVLDLSYEEDWVYSFPVGSWRRIVMNLFGNAVKYTGSGCKFLFVFWFSIHEARFPVASENGMPLVWLFGFFSINLLSLSTKSANRCAYSSRPRFSTSTSLHGQHGCSDRYNSHYY